MERNLKELIQQMTLEEKAGMCSGLDFWHLKGVERLGIPSVMVTDGPHGLRKQDMSADHLGINDSIKAVCFPPACLSACSFDSELVEEMGQAVGQEAQAEQVSVVLGPAVNIKRSPLCGRNFEYYSEDPYLAGEIAASFIKGVQSENIGTSIKHFAANNQEFNRMTSSSEVDERTMREIYLPAFETAVKKSQPYTVMCSYNKINGVFASENPWLLTDVLRSEWGFKGYVMSDWGAVNERVPGLKAGMDLEMPASGGATDQEIVAAVKDGSLEEAVLDLSVERILNIIFQYYDNRKELPFTKEKDHELAKKIAEESMVLLKNDSILPLKKEQKILFVGEFAEKPRYQGGGSSHINSFKVSSALECVSANSNVTFVKGFSSTEDNYDQDLALEAAKAAKEADVVVVFAGLPDSFESEGYDRKHMNLPSCQNLLIKELANANPNIVVVLHNGSPIEIPWISEVKGILEAYLGGQACGEAVVNLLFGDSNPCGKLAETFPKKLSDNPSFLSFGDAEKVYYTERDYVGYRYYDAKDMEVLFPFGFGLSYTSFEYSNLKLDKSQVTDQEMLTVSVDITNTGHAFGKEIVQLYVSDRTHTVRRPLKELKGFTKVSLAPGETKAVVFTLDKRSFAWYNTELGDWYAASGAYHILVGSSSDNMLQTASVELESTVEVPVKMDMNTTLGVLLTHPKYKDAGMELIEKMSVVFGGGSSDSDNSAIGDDMMTAMAYSMPLRNMVSFGIMQKEEVLAFIDKMNA
ncbi:MAG: glycoside hydrolase family 3 C-terminal domain-containing protein [Lachnospiraceae bacterium]